jgi:cyclohexanecarboxylate-CoA ligase
MLFLATLELGAVAVPLVPTYSSDDVKYCCEEAGVNVAFFDAARSGARMELQTRPLQSLSLVADVEIGQRLGFLNASRPLSNPQTGHWIPVDDTEIAVVLFTSGTESRPKGVLHSQATLLYESRTMLRYLDLSARDVFFAPSPLSHITGLLNGVIAPVELGATAVLQSRWSVPDALDLIRIHRCTYAVMATPFVKGLLDIGGAEGLRSFRYIRCGGADIPPGLMSQAEQASLTVLRVYGLSELPTVTCTSPSSDREHLMRSDGQPLPNIVLKIVDDDGRELGPGHEGHILAAGPEMCLGYLRAELNGRAFTEDGFLRTGDLGVLDTEGYLQITGRAKDIIVRGGENISALEVEGFISQIPAVAEVAVVGVADPVMGQRACAFIVPAISSAAIDVSDIRKALISMGVAIQKAPEYVVAVDRLPYTASGKVRKGDLRTRFESNQF